MLKCSYTWHNSPVTEQSMHRLVLSRGIGCSEGYGTSTFSKLWLTKLFICYVKQTVNRQRGNNKVFDKIVAGKWDHSSDHARTSKFLRHIIGSEIGLANCCLNYRPYTVLNRKKTCEVQWSKLLWFVLKYDPLYYSEKAEKSQKRNFIQGSQPRIDPEPLWVRNKRANYSISMYKGFVVHYLLNNEN
jgi:hypothetical protein